MNRTKVMLSLSTLVVLGTASVTLISHTPTVQAQAAEPKVTTISVSGSADEKVSPDTAMVSTGVIVKAPTAAEAQAKNNQAMNRVMNVLKAEGISAHDIQTAWYNLQPNYGQPKNGVQTIQGFEADDTVNVTIHSLNKVGPTIDALVKAGANQINDVSYEVSNPQAVQKSLYNAALDDAHSQAQAIAQKLGLTLTGVQSVNTSNGGVGPIMKANFGDMATASSAAVLSPGTQDISTSIQVVYTAE